MAEFDIPKPKGPFGGGFGEPGDFRQGQPPTPSYDMGSSPGLDAGSPPPPRDVRFGFGGSNRRRTGERGFIAMQSGNVAGASGGSGEPDRCTPNASSPRDGQPGDIPGGRADIPPTPDVPNRSERVEPLVNKSQPTRDMPPAGDTFSIRPGFIDHPTEVTNEAIESGDHEPSPVQKAFGLSLELHKNDPHRMMVDEGEYTSEDGLYEVRLLAIDDPDGVTHQIVLQSAYLGVDKWYVISPRPDGEEYIEPHTVTERAEPYFQFRDQLMETLRTDAAFESIPLDEDSPVFSMLNERVQAAFDQHNSAWNDMGMSHVLDEEVLEFLHEVKAALTHVWPEDLELPLPASEKGPSRPETVQVFKDAIRVMRQRTTVTSIKPEGDAVVDCESVFDGDGNPLQVDYKHSTHYKNPLGIPLKHVLHWRFDQDSVYPEKHRDYDDLDIQIHDLPPAYMRGEIRKIRNAIKAHTIPIEQSPANHADAQRGYAFLKASSRAS